MIKRICIALSILLVSHVFAQELYPIAKDGQWGLLSEGNEIVVAPQYDNIHYDNRGKKFVFNVKGLEGVMDLTGSIIEEAKHERVYFFTPDLIAYKNDKKWILKNEGKLIDSTLCDTIWQVTTDVYALKNGKIVKLYQTKTKIFNTTSYASIKMEGEFLVANYLGKVGFDILNKSYLSEEAENGASFYWWSWSKGYLNYPDSIQLVDKSSGKFLSKKFKTINHEFDEWYLCKNDSEAFLLNILTNEYISIPEIDALIDIQGNLMVYKKGALAGVWNFKTDKEVFPLKYEGLALQGNSIFTSQGGNFGLANTSSGKELFKPEYSSILKYDNVYVVGKETGLGLASLSGKIIEPLEHYEIEVFDNNVKCYTPKHLVTISLDGAGNVSDRTNYDSYMKVNFMKAKIPRQNAKNLSFGDRNTSETSVADLNKLGWFQQEIEKVEEDTIITVKGRWGLIIDDSLWIKYSYYGLDIKHSVYHKCYRAKPLEKLTSDKDFQKAVRQRHYYSIVPNPENTKKDKGISTAYSKGWFEIVNRPKQVRFSRDRYQELKMKDWEKYALARGVQNTAILVDTMGYVLYDSITYFDDYRENRILICQGGQQVATETYQGTFSISSFFQSMGYESYLVDPNYRYYSVKNGNWYFIDKDGKRLNENPFDYATEFFQQKSIVSRHGKWGVIDTAMNIIVPLEFDHVERLYADGKTYFKVTSAKQQRFFYDRATSTYTETNLREFKDYSHGYWLVKDPGRSRKWAIADTSLNILTDYYLYEGNGVTTHGRNVQIERDKFLLNPDGSVKYPEDTKIIDKVTLDFDRIMVMKSKTNFHVTDKSGNMIIPPYSCSKIHAQNENYIFYFDGNLRMQMWSKNKAKLPKKTELLSGDPNSEVVLVLQGKTKKLYSLKTGEFLTKKSNEIISLEKEGYIFETETGKKGMVSYTGDTLMKPIYESIEFYFDRDWGIAKPVWNQKFIIKHNGQQLFDQVFKEIDEYNGFYKVQTETKSGMIKANGEVFIPIEFSALYLYMTDYYKAYLDGKTVFFELDGTEMCRVQSFTNEGFPCGGFKTSVRNKYYYHEYLSNGYNNFSFYFDQVIPISPSKFILQLNKIEGLYSADGDVIIPPEYQSIWEDRGKFRCRYFNSYGYFSQDGIPLFDPKTGQ